MLEKAEIFCNKKLGSQCRIAQTRTEETKNFLCSQRDNLLRAIKEMKPSLNEDKPSNDVKHLKDINSSQPPDEPHRNLNNVDLSMTMTSVGNIVPSRDFCNDESDNRTRLKDDCPVSIESRDVTDISNRNEFNLTKSSDKVFRCRDSFSPEQKIFYGPEASHDFSGDLDSDDSSDRFESTSGSSDQYISSKTSDQSVPSLPYQFEQSHLNQSECSPCNVDLRYSDDLYRHHGKFARSNSVPINTIRRQPKLDEPLHIIKERQFDRPHSIVTGSDDSLPSMPEDEETDFCLFTSSGQCRAEALPQCFTSYGDAGDYKRNMSLVMREIIQTERDYVESLEYVVTHYMPEISREDIPQGLRGKRNQVFGNLERICQFHRQYFLSEVEACQHRPFHIATYFLMHEREFYMYALYNKNKPRSDVLMAELGKDFFREKQEQLNDKMDLSSYLLKPVQRMGKYALLLRQMLKACPSEAEYSELKKAEEMVKFQLRHGNDLLAMDSLRDCDVNLLEQGKLLRQEEFHVWQGRKKALRRVFLFEDLILFSKIRPSRQGGHDTYLYKYSIKTSDIGLTASYQDSKDRFEIWFRRRKNGENYILQAANVDIRNDWIKDISGILWSQAFRNRELRLTEMATMGIGSKPCIDIKPSADNINDRFVEISLSSKAARARNSIAVVSSEFRSNKRPHSVISLSSTSSSNSSGQSTSLYLGSSLSSPFCPEYFHLRKDILPSIADETGQTDSGDVRRGSLQNEYLRSPHLFSEI